MTRSHSRHMLPRIKFPGLAMRVVLRHAGCFRMTPHRALHVAVGLAGFVMRHSISFTVGMILTLVSINPN